MTERAITTGASAGREVSLAARVERLSSVLARESLQVIVEAAVASSGFTIAAIALVPHADLPQHRHRPRSTRSGSGTSPEEHEAAGSLSHAAGAAVEVVAVAGSQQARVELSGMRIPLQPLLNELDSADDWGLFKFVPAERIDLRAGEGHWIPDLEPLRGSDAWKPLDLLAAPLCDHDGHLYGVLSIDVPQDGQRPNAEQRHVLEVLARQARDAVINITERERLTEQVHLAEAARQIVRQAAEHHSLQHVIDTAKPALLSGLQALGMWLQTYNEQGLTSGTVYSADGKTITFPESVHAIAYNAAHALWDAQQALVLSTRRHTRMLTPAESRDIGAFLTSLSLESILFVPLGSGSRCLGNLVLTRGPGAPEWDDLECAAALEIGRDLGVAIDTVRAREREHALTRELHVLDTHVNDLVANLATTPALQMNASGQADQAPSDRLASAGTGDPDAADHDADDDVVDRMANEADPDPRTLLRAASHLLEQTGRRRDAQARIIADQVTHRQAPSADSVEVYRTLNLEYRDARLNWQIAFDVWQDANP